MSKKEDKTVVEAEPVEPAELSRQEENWRLMTILQIPWHHANRIEDEDDRCLLLEKTKEVEKYLKSQQEAQEMMQMQMQQQQQQQQMQQQPSQIITPSSNPFGP